MKILWHSELIQNTGFSNVSRNLIDNLKSSLDITVLEWTQKFINSEPRTVYKMDGFKIIGIDKEDDKFGHKKMMSLNLDMFDCIFFLNDSWNINELLKVLKYKKYKGKVVCYFPVDASGHDPEWYSDFDIVTSAVTYTEFAKKEVLLAAPHLEGRLHILPHGINKNVFYPIPEGKSSIRVKLWGNTEMDDKFIVLNNNRNQPRKRLDITMKAFSLFAKNKDNAMLYMHCGNTDTSMDITKLSVRYGIEDKLIVTSGFDKGGIPKLSEESLNLIYNACDVGLNTSMGEGWGLTNTEMACAMKPQIVPDHSACAELFSDVGLLSKCIAEYTFDNLMTIGKITDPYHIAELLDKLYFDYNLYSQMAKRAYDKFTGKEYDWADISNKWLSFFDKN